MSEKHEKKRIQGALHADSEIIVKVVQSLSTKALKLLVSYPEPVLTLVVLCSVLALALGGCSNDSSIAASDNARNKYMMTCSGGDIAKHSFAEISRCENEEVVCYASSHGIACKFKSQ